MKLGPFAVILLLALASVASAADPGVRREWFPMRSQYNGLFLADLIAPSLEYTGVRWRMGDDSAWARPDLDDGAWSRATLLNIPSHAGVFWIRFRVRDENMLPPGIFVQATMAYDLYWDGERVGRSGVPGTDRETEKTGLMDNMFMLSEAQRRPGVHTVAMRVSNYRNRFPGSTMPFRFMLVDPAAYHAFNNRSNLGPTLAIGATLMLGLTAAVMWLVAARRWVLLLFAAMCLAGAAMQAMLVARFVFGYTYEWHFWAWMALGFSAAAFGGFLLALLLVHFALPRWTLLSLVVLPIVIGIPGHQQSLPVYLMAAFVVAVVAASLRRRGAWFVLAGLALTLVLWRKDPIHLMSGNFFQFVLPTFVGLTIAVALDVRAERERARQAQLATARLEIELLKKNIQPHFLLNTLATIQEVIEQAPRRAVALIDALAAEFRILARVSGEPLITLAQELELCRAHLDVMSLRKGARCTLETCGVDRDAMVPPALFHTLIENGLTHLLPRDGRLEFELRADRLADGVRYTLIARGQRQANAGPTREGTGTRYIKARLEESFSGQWRFAGVPVPEGWETMIEIHGHPAPSPRVPAAPTPAVTASQQIS